MSYFPNIVCGIDTTVPVNSQTHGHRHSFFSFMLPTLFLLDTCKKQSKRENQSNRMHSSNKQPASRIHIVRYLPKFFYSHDRFVTGPDVVKTVTNEDVTKEDLGGSKVHVSKSGVAHGRFENDVAAMRAMRRFLDFLPSSNNKATLPVKEATDSPDRLVPEVARLVPDDPNTPYDMKVSDTIYCIGTVVKYETVSTA